MTSPWPAGSTSRVPVLRDEWREPLRALRDPLAATDRRVRARRDRKRQWRKQTWLGRFVSTYGWRAYALPVLMVLTTVVVYQTVTDEHAKARGGPDRPGLAGHWCGGDRDPRRTASRSCSVRCQSAGRDAAGWRPVHRGW